MDVEEKEGVEAEVMSEMVAEVAGALNLTNDEPEGDPPPEGEIAAGAAEPEAGAAGAEPAATSSDGKGASPAPAPGAAPAASGPPDSWTKEAKADWAKVPPNLQKEILKREKDVVDGFGRVNQMAGVGQTFANVVKPFFPVFQQHRIDPAQHAQRLFGIHHTLAFGQPAQKLAVFQGLLKEFGIAAEQLQGGEAPFVDPAVASLTAELQGVKSVQQQFVASQQAAETARLTTEVEAFAAKHPHFEAVGADIARLLETRAVKSLQEAYDTAIWANPTTRALLLAEQEKERKAAETAERSARAAKAARSTAANVRSAPKGRGPTPPKGSIEETLNATADKLFADLS